MSEQVGCVTLVTEQARYLVAVAERIRCIFGKRVGWVSELFNVLAREEVKTEMFFRKRYSQSSNEFMDKNNMILMETT